MSQYHTPSPVVGQFPLDSASLPDSQMFPPVCLKTHWDPTEMVRRILPHQSVALPQDPRPLVRVCKQYKTSTPAMPAPMPPSHMVFPTGGQFYPPGRYSSRIDDESVLRTLDQPLNKWGAGATQYIPEEESTLYVAGSTVPDRQPTSNAFIAELAMPQALLRTDGRTCRSENDTLYFERSGRLFNNPTKQDRYGADKFYSLPDAHHGRGEPMAHGGVPMPRTVTGQAGQGRWKIPQPGGAVPLGQRRLATVQSDRDRARPSRTSVVGVTTSGLSAPVW
jgi:hypothetical protein